MTTTKLQPNKAPMEAFYVDYERSLRRTRLSDEAALAAMAHCCTEQKDAQNWKCFWFLSLRTNVWNANAFYVGGQWSVGMGAGIENSLEASM